MLAAIKAKKEAITTVVYPVTFFIIIALCWQYGLLNKLLHTDTNTLPPPSKIFRIISEASDRIMPNVELSLKVALGGLVFGSLLGYAIAIIATIFPRGGAGGLSLVAAFNAVPIVALAPVINNLTKRASDDVDERSLLAKMLVVMIVCTAAMSINAYQGLTQLKPFSDDLMKTYAANPFVVFFKLRLPNSIPFIFTALKVSLPASIIGALVSEYFSEKVGGVGRMIRENILQAQYSTAWAYIMVACLMGMALYMILLIFEGILLGKRRN